MYRKRNKELAILTLYCGDYKRQIYLREISKLARIPLKTTQSLLGKLEDMSMLRSTVKGKNKYFVLNLDNVQTKLLVLQAEIYRTSLFLEMYPQFKTFLKALRTDTMMVVFGSFAKLAADKNSDLDLLIVSTGNEKLPFHLISNKTHIINMSEHAFMKGLGKEALIKEVMSNHVILNNHSFFVNNVWNRYE